MKRMQINIKKAVLMLSVIAVSQFVQAQSGDSSQKIDSLERQVAALTSEVQQHKQEKEHQKIWGREKSWSIAYLAQSIKPEGAEKLKSKFGITLNRGRNIYFHKKPIGNVLKFGIEYGVEVSYANYKDVNVYEWNEVYHGMELNNVSAHQVDAGVFLGPTVTVNPVSKLKVKVYFHFVPSYDLLIIDDQRYSNFVPYFSYGGEVSYGRLGIGIEGRTGQAKIKEKNKFFSAEKWVENRKCRFNGFRVYLTIKI